MNDKDLIKTGQDAYRATMKDGPMMNAVTVPDILWSCAIITIMIEKIRSINQSSGESLNTYWYMSLVEEGLN